MSYVWTALGTLLATVVGGIWLRSSKRVGYEILEMKLTKSHPEEKQPYRIGVLNKNKEVELAKDIYGFLVLLENVGNRVIDESVIEIELDQNAQILEYEISPKSQAGYQINFPQCDTSNCLKIQIPYLNRCSPLFIRLISSNNQTKKCKVKYLSKGTSISRRFELAPMLAAFIFLLFAILLSLLSTRHEIFPSYLVNFLGGRIETVERIEFPFFADSILFIIFILLYLVAFCLGPIKQKLRRKSFENMIWGLTNKKKNISSLLQEIFL